MDRREHRCRYRGPLTLSELGRLDIAAAADVLLQRAAVVLDQAKAHSTEDLVVAASVAVAKVLTTEAAPVAG